MERGERIFIRPLTRADASSLLELRRSNRDFLTPWEPRRDETFWTLEAQEAEIERGAVEAANDQGVAFGILLNHSEELVGRVALSNIVRGIWQNATLGYFVGRQHNGKGYATEAVHLTLRFAFESARLHRVQAGVIQRNAGSIRVLERAGFRFEGVSPRYLNINGVWEDHRMYAITVEEWTV